MRLFAFVTVLAASTAAFAQSIPAQEKLALTPINVIPMDCDCVLENQTLLMADGVIVDVGAADELNIPEGFKEVDGMGRYIMPGLSDMHVHFRDSDESALLNYLHAGITLVREMNGRPFFAGMARRYLGKRNARPADDCCQPNNGQSQFAARRVSNT